jgi:hypothetical protein
MGTRYGLSLMLDCDNAAFDDGNRANEAAAVLRRLANKLEYDYGETLARGERATGYLRDSNGNTCGTWKAMPRRIRN